MKHEIIKLLEQADEKIKEAIDEELNRPTIHFSNRDKLRKAREKLQEALSEMLEVK